MTQPPTITLNNDVVMPQIGLGVWQAKEGDEVESAVTAALEAGYRLIDTAAAYGNERGVGQAIARSGIPRDEIFVTTKLWNADHGYDEALAGLDASLDRLQMEYVDLYLIHWPVPATDKYLETWRAFEKLYQDGKARAIGVSNFTPEHLKRLLADSEITPAVNQIELHPYFQQPETRAFCRQHNIAVESYSPLSGRGGELLDEPLLEEIAETYGKTPAQIVIRWHIQHGLIVIPKSVHTDRIAENIDVFDFQLSHDEMAQIDDLSTDARSGSDPDEMDAI